MAPYAICLVKVLYNLVSTRLHLSNLLWCLFQYPTKLIGATATFIPPQIIQETILSFFSIKDQKHPVLERASIL